MAFWILFSGVLFVSFVIVHAQVVQMDVISYREVTTTFGPVRGNVYHINDDLDLEVYLGIRYAKAPVGELRFAKPEPPDPWTDVMDATVHGPQCLQREMLSGIEMPFGVSEDCLFLDVYTLRYKNETDHRNPTFMFIHGGGYLSGTGAKFNFTNLALRGATVVTINYRLDVFGFLSTQDKYIPGNYGLLDQILALDWINNNTETFGGDLGSITLMGGSSGASSISILKLSPLSRDKFHKAIMQSGSSTCFWAAHSHDQKHASPREVAAYLGTVLECPLPELDFGFHLRRCLCKANATDILQAGKAIQDKFYKGNMIFIPVTEKRFGVLPRSPLTLLINHTEDLTYIPTMYGYMRDDSSIFVAAIDPTNDGITEEEFKEYVKQLLHVYYPSDQTIEIYNKIVENYLPNEVTDMGRREILVRMTTTWFYTSCMMTEASLFNNVPKSKDAKSYFFEFNHRPSYSNFPTWMGVTHVDLTGFILGFPDGPDPYSFPAHTYDDDVVSDFTMATSINFAKFGNPTPSPVHYVTWPEYLPRKNEKIMLMEILPKTKDFDKGSDVAFWSSLMLNAGGRIAPVETWVMALATCASFWIFMFCWY